MRIAFFANTDWYLFNFRRALALELQRRGAEVLLLSPEGQYGEMLRSLGLRWHPVRMDRRNVNPLREVAALLELVRIYRRERPDIVHHFTLKCVILGSFAARLSGIERRVNAITGMGYLFHSSGLRARLLRPTIRKTLNVLLRGKKAHTIVQNQDDLAAMLKLGSIRRELVHVIRGSGVDTEYFAPRSSARARGSRFTVLLAARLVVEKGVVEYVAAARQLKSEGLDIEFLLAGDVDTGNPASIASSMISEWAESRVVTVLGHVDDMVTCLHRVDAVVLPSYGEGMPRSLVEASSCGLPVVATDVPGCREAVEHGVTGLLVASRDSRAIADAVKYLYNHPEAGHRMGVAGRERICREFGERAVLGRTIDVYRILLPDCRL